VFYTSPMLSYLRQKKLGEGTYAVVYLAQMVQSSGPHKIIKSIAANTHVSTVAIKKIKHYSSTTGIDLSTVREIKNMQRVQSKYVLTLFEVFFHNNSVNMALEYAPYNLEHIIKNRQLVIMPSDIKAIMLMVMKGVYAIHRKFIVHRDLKPNNILLDANGIVKIADFGLSRDLGDNMTSYVVTRWYRAPELLFGAKVYGFNVDMWSIGCIFAELFLRVPFFAGENDLNQLDVIFRALGTPTEHDWPGMCTLSNFVKLPSYPRVPPKTIFTGATDDAIELLEKMLVFEPQKRISSYNALKHAYFSGGDRPTLPKNLIMSLRTTTEHVDEQ
ncbi:Cdk activating kinase (CAK)/RNA polymerase II, partial [Trachipleistophora hominis]